MSKDIIFAVVDDKPENLESAEVLIAATFPRNGVSVIDVETMGTYSDVERLLRISRDVHNEQFVHVLLTDLNFPDCEGGKEEAWGLVVAAKAKKAGWIVAMCTDIRHGSGDLRLPGEMAYELEVRLFDSDPADATHDGNSKDWSKALQEVLRLIDEKQA